MTHSLRLHVSYTLLASSTLLSFSGHELMAYFWKNIVLMTFSLTAGELDMLRVRIRRA
jgi:hypothetical protein